MQSSQLEPNSKWNGKGGYLLGKKDDYTKIQIIQWQVTTRLVGSQDANDVWSGKVLNPELISRKSGYDDFSDSNAVYETLSEVAKAHSELNDCDAITRLLTLYDVMNAAALHTDTDKKTLKVFIAPDGYFSDSKSGSYSLAQTRLIKHLLHTTICSQQQFQNWLILPGTIKWKNSDNPFQGVSNIFFSMAPLNTSAVVLYRGNSPLTMADGKVLNNACFFIEPVSEQPSLFFPKPMFSDFDVYAPQKAKQEQDLRRHLFDIGDLNIGLEINEEQENAAQGKNSLSQALKTMGRDPQSLGLQILLSSSQLLLEESLNIRIGGIASSINGLVGVLGEAEPVSYQLFQRRDDNKPLKTSNSFMRKNFVLEDPLILSGEPSKSYCYNTLGQEQVMIFNYDFGMLRVFKSIKIGEDE